LRDADNMTTLQAQINALSGGGSSGNVTIPSGDKLTLIGNVVIDSVNIRPIEIKQLEERKTDLKQSIQKDKATINQLENIDSLEKFARENYGHKREDETIFIVED